MSAPAPRSGSRLGTAAVRFHFDGCEYQGFAGDTAASALMANGVRLLARSVKYHRPRGLLALGPEEPNALLSVGRAPASVPNVPAPMLAIADGMRMTSQNRWPTLRHDFAALLGLGGGLLGAGFYYKTFMWPSWRSYEGMIRRLAGFGSAPAACNLRPPQVEHVRCDVLVVGAGAAGLAAALAAMRAGASVVVCEREPRCGGELEFETAAIDGVPAQHWVADALSSLASGGARVLTETAVVGGSADLVVAHREPGGLPANASVFRIQARAMVVATGAIERPIAFVNNDLPGVMLQGAAERLWARYGVRAGERLVIFGNHDRIYASARRLLAAGSRVVAIVDTRVSNERVELADLASAGVQCLTGHAVIAAAGSRAVHTARVAPLAFPDQLSNIGCDAILVSGGWTPSLQVGLHEGGARQYAAELGAFVAGGATPRRISCGAAQGYLELGQALSDGYAAGRAAAAAATAAAASAGSAPARSAAPSGRSAAPSGRGDGAPQLALFWRSPASRAQEKRQFVDLQNDVTVADLRQAWVEGFRDIEHVKRYTTLGIGTEQGRTSGVLGAAILAEISGQPLAAVGISRTRAPFTPATLSSLAGERQRHALRPERRTPLHDWHLANGGELESMGLWMRPRYYRANGADATHAGIAEAARVRAHGGIVDGSTLGKLEVAGKDAPAFLDWLYLTRASTIRVGRSRYMVMLREDGCVLDDGLVLRLAEDRFVATVSSGHAGHVLAHFEFWQAAGFSQHRVTITDVTEAWAVIAVAGPHSRAVLREVLGADWHAAMATLKHMDFATGRWGSRELRVLRASFSGELAFELHCRPASAASLWQALVDGGLAPYGLEALDILRVEKGYLVSTELNGQTTPHDLGMDALLKSANACIGRELLDRPGLHEQTRPRLVGLHAADGRSSFLGGAQLTRLDESRHACGYVTSAVYSPAMGQWIALALVARNVPPGTELIARDPLHERETRVRVSAPVFVDPHGERLKS